MAEYAAPGQTMYKAMDVREALIVDKVFMLFEQINAFRINHAAQWEETAELIWPNSRNTFFRWNVNFPGMKKTDRMIDSTGMLALNRFSAILDSLLTPRNMQWHTLAPDDDSLAKRYRVRIWFENATRAMFKQRYMATANFVGQNIQNWKSLGAFGNAGMFIDRLVGPRGEPLNGLRYKSIPLGELFVRENHQGVVDAFVRAFRLTAKQAIARWGDKCPPALFDALTKQSEELYDFFHCVVPNDDYDPLRMDAKHMAYASYYVSVQGRCLLQEGGYNSFPLQFARYDQAPWETYGRGPATDVLPSLKTLNAQKRMYLKQGHRAADPVLLTNDDGLLDTISLRPGVINKGGINDQGKLMVATLPTGEIQVSEEMMAEERNLINDSFLVTLFQIMTETPQMTATEVVERINEKGILLAPTVGRQQSEYLGPMIDRELDLMVDIGLLDPPPPELLEAKGAYHVVYTSPLARSQRAQEASGFLRTVESMLEVAQQMQDPSLLDPFAFDRAVPAIAEIQNVPPSWMATKQEVAQKVKNRADSQQRQEQIQAMPAQAAMVKANAAAAKSGGGQPQQGQQQQAQQPQQP